MADKAVDELILAEQITETDLFVLQQNNTAKKLQGRVLLHWLTQAADGHGGIKDISKTSTQGLVDTYTITFADSTTSSFSVSNGNGIKSITKSRTSGLVDTYSILFDNNEYQTFNVTNGAEGKSSYLHIKWALTQPTEENPNFGDTPSAWMGIAVSNSAVAPELYSDYSWNYVRGPMGASGPQGLQGPRGPSGPANPVTYSSTQYALSDNGETAPGTSEWVDDIPVATSGMYMWVRHVIRYTYGGDHEYLTCYYFGRDGLTPFIGENGNWWIGDSDTGVSAGNSNGGSSSTLDIDKTLSISGKAADAKAVGDALNGKVDREGDKGLSSNDYTTAEKQKLAGVEAGANNYTLTKQKVVDALGYTPSQQDTKVTVDEELSTGSTNPVQNKVVTAALDSISGEIDNKLAPYATKEWTLEKIEEATGSETSQEDLMPKRTTTYTQNGITFTPVENGYSVSGTATSIATYAVYKDGMPDGIVAGGKYIFDSNGNYNTYITIQAYNSDNVLSTLLTADDSGKFEFTVPMDTVKVAFRLGVRSGATVDMVYSPHVYAAPEMQYPNPMLTIVDDDGYQKFATLLLPVIQTKKCPIGTAIIGKNVGESFAMSAETIKNCALEGAEILSHSWSHLTESAVTDLEQYEIQYDYQKMKNFLSANGVGTDCLIFGGNSATVEKCQNAAQMVYGYAFNPGANKVNQKYSTQRYNIARFGIDAGDNLTTENLQSMLDELASAGTGWMVWTIHTSSNLFQQAEADIISAAIDYARSKEIEIVTTAYGVKQYVVD